jgi:hypothetical protein
MAHPWTPTSPDQILTAAGNGFGGLAALLQVPQELGGESVARHQRIILQSLSVIDFVSQFIPDILRVPAASVGI